MSNNVILVGRLVGDLELKKTESGKKYANVVIAVTRAYKNEYGIYDTDFIDITLFGLVAENTCEWCRKGDIVGVRGRLETSVIVNDNGEKHKSMHVVADRISFLKSSKGASVENA